ncbi:hypothetical protein O6H91_02G122700 [Diphasiastrum complanatum]|uniref:Uncharacterized protein n=1 Tax=Diphasiastrum complanatum TaxID=34168 RepID=A0ACC2EKF7_DIPCM|nr:hypothetical protein O6H91_02G122700 [Diphasiastrum complanatum]
MSTDSVKLLTLRASPYAMRAILALEAKGVKYELIEEDLSAQSQLWLESNPVYKKIPVLLHGGKAIPESLFIVLYVDEAWPERALSFRRIHMHDGFTQLDAKPFFNGTGIGYADIFLAPLAAWLRLFVELAGIRAPTAEEAPKLHKFFNAIREHPATKVAFPDPDELLSYVILHVKRTMAA